LKEVLDQQDLFMLVVVGASGKEQAFLQALEGCDNYMHTSRHLFDRYSQNTGC
jgi:hypothetical protein